MNDLRMMVENRINTLISEMCAKYRKENGMIEIPLHVISEEIGFQIPVTSRLYENVFRARPLYDPFLSLAQLESKYSLVSEFGPNPSKNVKADGRCNLKEESSGYFSLDSGTPIFEMRPEKGQFIALSKFNNPQKVILDLGVIGGSFIINKINQDRRYKQCIDDALYKFLNKQPSFSIEAILNKYDTENNCKKYAFDKLLSSTFTQSNENLEVKGYFKGTTLYKQTNEIKNFLSNFFSDSGDKIKGILYPSVQSEYFSMCGCCSPEVFKHTFSYDSGVIYEVINVDGRNVDLQSTFESKKDEGRIKWIDVKDKYRLWKLRTDSQIITVNVN